MSKEIELLEEVLKVLEWNGIMGSHDTYNSIKELLAQPEQEQFPLPGERLIEMWRDGYDAGVRLAQSKQEPMVWAYEYAVRSSFDASFTGEWKEEISRTKPDGVVKGFNPTKLESTVRNLVPLYLTPPTREPLSDEEIGKICKDHFFVASLSALIKTVEKAHGIGVDDE